MIDLHTHTIFSDGELLPSELARRAKVKGYRAVAITDHVDHTNFDFVIERVSRISGKLSEFFGIAIIPGAEITHVPPELIPDLIKECRKAGAKLIVVHGETPVEPVKPGTNLAAIEGRADILAHPGLISEDEAKLAAELGVMLEITARKGHCLSNGHVYSTAYAYGARFVINTDAHSPSDLMDFELARLVGLGAGMSEEEVARAFENAEELLRRALN